MKQRDPVNTKTMSDRLVAATEVGALPFLNPDPPATLSRSDCGPGVRRYTANNICRSLFLVVLITQS
jgi:hypothetical protein